LQARATKVLAFGEFIHYIHTRYNLVLRRLRNKYLGNTKLLQPQTITIYNKISCYFFFLKKKKIRFDIEITSTNFDFIYITRQGIELYDPKGFNQSEILSQSNFDPLNRFINILKDLASAFEKLFMYFMTINQIRLHLIGINHYFSI
jgi:hypothetical protein